MFPTILHRYCFAKFSQPKVCTNLSIYFYIFYDFFLFLLFFRLLMASWWWQRRPGNFCTSLTMQQNTSDIQWYVRYATPIIIILTFIDIFLASWYDNRLNVMYSKQLWITLFTSAIRNTQKNWVKTTVHRLPVNSKIVYI